MKPVKQSELLDAIVTALRAPTADKEKRADPAARAPRGPKRRGRRRAGWHILLAEDNAINQTLAIILLEKQGHTVVVANNGKEALAGPGTGAVGEFDLVLMDVQMPEMDGFEVTAHIRAQEKGTGHHVPIIAMTAHAMKGDRERCLQAGMDGYVAKPIQPGRAGAAPGGPRPRWPSAAARRRQRGRGPVPRHAAPRTHGLLDRAAGPERVGKAGDTCTGSHAEDVPGRVSMKLIWRDIAAAIARGGRRGDVERRGGHTLKGWSPSFLCGRGFRRGPETWRRSSRGNLARQRLLGTGKEKTAFYPARASRPNKVCLSSRGNAELEQIGQWGSESHCESRALMRKKDSLALLTRSGMYFHGAMPGSGIRPCWL